ncbi:uncharacterized protein PAS_chr2-2_0093 [Komagataella phaffii GS115]|uniref:Metal-dependent protein hydrolase n=2 Tax=Komagataella phaffii TaxID=460519 RepID=C4R2W1_KOMPG|nr:uncharacterized protein PAS_chr2-2_0093 [Komagataella phaffii GS115]AOA62495.1 GQ67_01253T0 [Komagataella phaffii]AOA67637.1 GQ68_00137T0 [Komagataella phaffii GS115]CAY69835.1 Putative protein of unknown function [Komagataella phaffii GS115]
METQTESKKRKLDMLKICTHSGSFHADEALAVYLLRSLKKWTNSTLLRSRDPAKWEEADIVVDVGGKYDDVKFFDHHQREFSTTFSDKYQTKLSSAGLVFKKFGKEVIAEKLNWDLNEESTNINILYEKLYKDFIESVDANDNGVSNYENTNERKFNDKNFTLASVVSNLNPLWVDEPTDADFDKQFEKASEIMGQVFDNLLLSYGRSWLPAKQFVEKAFDERFQAHPSGKVLVFDRFVPWKEHLYGVEIANKCHGEILYVLFPDSGNNWRIAAVPVSSSSFESRKALPEPWRGLRDEKLSEAANVEGCVFIHAAGFIGGANSKEGVLKLAALAVDN